MRRLWVVLLVGGLCGVTVEARGDYRWCDVADQLYSDDYRLSYDYSQATVEITYDSAGTVLAGTLTARNLKPNFAYQLKLLGLPGTSANELIGLVGRWWQEEWNGSEWVNGRNLNDKGDGSSPNPNDIIYFATRDIADESSPNGLRFKYIGYLVFDYFMTDGTGAVTLSFEVNGSYHVLWKPPPAPATNTQRVRTEQDGSLVSHTYDVDPASSAAYDVDYGEQTVGIFGEWERLPVGDIYLPPGYYGAKMILTEESFHGSGESFAGMWSTATSDDVQFTIILGVPCECPCHGDPQCDSVFDVFDVVRCADEGFRGGASIVDSVCSHISRNDANCDCVVDIFDVIEIINRAFRNNTDPLCDPCVQPCP